MIMGERLCLVLLASSASTKAWLNERKERTLEYSYSDNEEMFYGKAATRELAIAEALDNYPDAETIWIGEATKKTIGGYFGQYDAESLMERLAESASEECGECAEDWLQGPLYPQVPRETPREEKERIQQEWKGKKADYLESLAVKIRAALEEWATENDEQPGFWHVDNIEELSRDEAQRIVDEPDH